MVLAVPVHTLIDPWNLPRSKCRGTAARLGCAVVLGTSTGLEAIRFCLEPQNRRRKAMKTPSARAFSFFPVHRAVLEPYLYIHLHG